jgi:hypothetical protein
MSTRNISWGERWPAGRADDLTTFMCWLSWNMGASTSWNPEGLSSPVLRLLYLHPYLSALLFSNRLCLISFYNQFYIYFCLMWYMPHIIMLLDLITLMECSEEYKLWTSFIFMFSCSHYLLYWWHLSFAGLPCFCRNTFLKIIWVLIVQTERGPPSS